MTAPQEPHRQECEKIVDRNDVIAFMKFAGFDIELAERTDGIEELTISGFDDTGDVYLFEFTPCAIQPPAPVPVCCAYWGFKDGKPKCSLLIPDPSLYVELTDAIKKEAAKQEREELMVEFRWMKPMCFGKHEAICDTRCSWIVRQRCLESLRSTRQEQPEEDER